MKLNDFMKMRLAFDKANVPAEGRIAIVDPVVEATLSGYVTLTSNITQLAVNIIQGGMARGQKFLWNIFGRDVITTTSLPVDPYTDGTNTGANNVGTIFICVDRTRVVEGKRL